MEQELGSNLTLPARVAAGLEAGMAFCTLLVGADLRVEWASPAVTPLLGHRPEEVVGTEALALVHPDDVPGLLALAAAERADPTPFGPDPASLVTNQFRVRTAAGTWRTVAMAANNQLDNPAVRAFVLVLRDASTEQLTIEVLRRLAAGEPVREVLLVVADLLRAQIRGADVVLAVGGGPERAPFVVVRGHPPVRPPDVAVPVDHSRGATELRVWMPAATPPTVWCRTLVERAAELVHLALTRELGEAELRRAAHTDGLTGVTNRTGLDALLERLASSHWGGLIAVLYVDLDGFKRVNDDHGHPMGDEVLVECATRLRACLRTNDLLARPGGDEFVAVCLALPGADAARAIAERMVAGLGRPIVLPTGHHVRCGATVGGAVGDHRQAHALLAGADAALLRAKRAGKGRVELVAGAPVAGT